MTPSLETKNFVLRAFESKDLKHFAAYRANPTIARFQSWSDYTYKDALHFFQNTNYSNFGGVGNWYQLAIANKQSDVLIGDLAVHFVDDQQVEIGFTVSPEFQGKGVAIESIKALLNFLFLELKKHRVIAITDTENTPLCRLLEKLGFRKEAHYVKNIFFKGAWGDEFLYAILGSEYCQVSKQ